MKNRSRPMRWKKSHGANPLLSREWLVTNGLGGYASGTVAGVPTRRYHGLLIAALAEPSGRMLMFNHLAERIVLPDGTLARVGGREHPGRLRLPANLPLTEFRLDGGLPVWRFEVGDVVIEKRLFMPHEQNTVHVQYRQLDGRGPLRLRLRPAFNVRPHDHSVDEPLQPSYRLTACQDRYEIETPPPFPPARIRVGGDRVSLLSRNMVIRNLHYRVEASRGYPQTGDMWSPGWFRAELDQDRPVTLTASVESWDVLEGLDPEEALGTECTRRQHLIGMTPERHREAPAVELVLAADQFLITPASRARDEARAKAAGTHARTVIAGYHWFTDWGRDTMISLEGLTLTTGRPLEAASILRTFAQHIRDGLIPNLFPEGQCEGVYHTADATLWFFHAIGRYLDLTGDRSLVVELLPKLLDIVDHHVRGTRFGIHVDLEDGLLTQGAEGYQLTWMDAKVEGWVVTPRRGKAVEINALWYNALRRLEGWLEAAGDHEQAGQMRAHADRAQKAFNERFWYEEGGYLYDVVDGEDGDDPACRPNQVFAISLTHPILDRTRWGSVMRVVEEQLLTPVGLRSLSPEHPDFKPTYDGDLRSRDAAYHQGTVWPWLIGPYFDAWRKLHPDDWERSRQLLDGLIAHLGEAGMGTISEICDATEPFTPRGCIAQAWSVAEVLRCLAECESGG